MLPPFSPLGDLKATVSQLQLVLSVPFILRIVVSACNACVHTLCICIQHIANIRVCTYVDHIVKIPVPYIAFEQSVDAIV